VPSRRWLVLVLFVGWMGDALAAGPAVTGRERISLNADWRFHKGDLEGQGSLDDTGWRHIDLPHDWGIEGPFDQEHPGETGKLPWWGVGWYRKHLTFPQPAPDRRYYLDIDGAMSYSQVWLNGQRVGGWPYGYASYRLDLTPFVRPGDNLLAVRLDNPPRSSRWYPGGGLYRNVWLVKTSSLHVAHWGTFVTTPQVSAREATVQIAVMVDNRSAAAARAVVKVALHALGTGDNPGAAVATSAPGELPVPAGEASSVTVTIPLRSPRLWSPGVPNRYLAVTTVERDGRLVDRHETVFGIRTIRFDPD
jgi:beta-galactosidase